MNQSRVGLWGLEVLSTIYYGVTFSITWEEITLSGPVHVGGNPDSLGEASPG